MAMRRVPDMTLGHAALDDDEVCTECPQDEAELADYVIDDELLCLTHGRGRLGL